MGIYENQKKILAFANHFFLAFVWCADFPDRGFSCRDVYIYTVLIILDKMMITALYTLLKAFLDPLVPVLILVFVGFLLSFRREKARYLRTTLLAAFIILYMGSISPVSNALCYIMERQYLMKHNGNAGKLDIVIVLGGGVSDNNYLGKTLPSYQTTSRLLHAIQVFRDSGAEYLVCAGKGGGKISEAEVMEIAAERLDVPAARIRIDPNSKNTREHAQELNKLF